MTTSPVQDRLTGLCDRLGHQFGDPGLLVQALTHRSWCAENDGGGSNERMELLGDSVLGLAVTEHTYHRYPDLAEGDLARLRAALVNTSVLAEVADEIGLGRHLRLGRGEDMSGGREKASILADGVEAVISAVYLDAGHRAASDLVVRLLGTRIDDAADLPGGFDAKTRLQELVARQFGGTAVSYRIDESGPDHEKSFRAEVLVGEHPMGVGEGPSKKQAEQIAARHACEQLNDDGVD